MSQILIRMILGGSLMLFAACGTSKFNQSSSLDRVSFVSENKILAISDDHLGRFGQEVAIDREAALTQLTPVQIDQFLEYINDPTRSHLPRYKRVFDYLEASTFQFNYLGETLIAADALALQQGNCMSLALLTTALAKVAGVAVGYQLIDSTPVFDIGDQAVVKGVHVRSKLYEHNAKLVHGGRQFTFERGGMVVDYFPEGNDRFLNNLQENDFFARFYRNKAVDFLQQGDFTKSYWFTRKSLELSPEDPEGANLMAILYKRIGDHQKAEEIYQHGLMVTKNKLSILKNYRQLLVELNRQEEVAELDQRIDGYDDPSPYQWLNLADQARIEGRFIAANNFYQKAIDRAPYLQFGYLGLAKSYFEQGNFDDSERMLSAAMERNQDPLNQKLYRAKLTYLQKRAN